MGEFLKKHNAVISVGTMIASCATLVGSYVWGIVRSDKRQINYYKKQEEVQQAEIDYFRGAKG